MAHAGAHQAFQLAALPQRIEPAQGGDDPWADVLAYPDAMGNLQASVGAGGFDAEERGGMGLGLPQLPRPFGEAKKGDS
jgi:hypothetical protein